MLSERFPLSNVVCLILLSLPSRPILTKKDSGNLVGYLILVPCMRCLTRTSNHHLFIFHPDAVLAENMHPRKVWNTRESVSGETVVRWYELDKAGSGRQRANEVGR